MIRESTISPAHRVTTTIVTVKISLKLSIGDIDEIKKNEVVAYAQASMV